MKSVFTLLFSCLFVHATIAQFKYINPLPGTPDHNPQTTIILKNGNLINPESVNEKALVEIKGSASGKHSWTARLSDDNKTVIIKPQVIFDYGETVSVTVRPKLRKATGETIEGTTFSFGIAKKTTPEEEEQFRKADLQSFIEEYGYDPTKKTNNEKVTYPLDSMPTYKINVNNNPAPGLIFYTNHEDQTGPLPETNSFTTIIQNDGTIVWARDVSDDGHDFKVNENGYLTYFIQDRHIWMIMDSNYNIIDSVQCKNGYEESTNNHDVMIYPDGHVFLIADKNKIIDMTAYGGQPNATVHVEVIQELDANRDVVFEWSGQDHFQFTDANSWISLTNSTVDYEHLNSIVRDDDGNILISSRNFDELTKIDISTGDIIWRMGGENNQFTFVNDNNPAHFAFQHDLKRLPNGDITIFNNANHMDPEVSSAKEYSLDEVNKVATLVWHYEHPDVNGVHVFGSATGNAQRLPNGNTMIDWGLIDLGLGLPNQTEVDYNKNIVWEMTFDSGGQKSYRVHKYLWDPCSRITGYTMKAVVKQASTNLVWGQATGAKSYKVQYRPLGTTTWTTKPSNKKTKLQLTGLTPSTSYEWHVQSLCKLSPLTVSTYSVLDTFTTLPLKLPEIEEALPEDVLSLYPVPVADKLTIEISEQIDANISILNILGSVMYENELQDDEAATLQVNTEKWPAGIYVVRVDDGMHPVMVRKFVKE